MANKKLSKILGAVAGAALSLGATSCSMAPKEFEYNSKPVSQTEQKDAQYIEETSLGTTLKQSYNGQYDTDGVYHSNYSCEDAINHYNSMINDPFFHMGHRDFWKLNDDKYYNLEGPNFEGLTETEKEIKGDLLSNADKRIPNELTLLKTDFQALAVAYREMEEEAIIKSGKTPSEVKVIFEKCNKIYGTNNKIEDLNFDKSEMSIIIPHRMRLFSDAVISILSRNDLNQTNTLDKIDGTNEYADFAIKYRLNSIDLNSNESNTQNYKSKLYPDLLCTLKMATWDIKSFTEIVNPYMEYNKSFYEKQMPENEREKYSKDYYKYGSKASLGYIYRFWSEDISICTFDIRDVHRYKSVYEFYNREMLLVHAENQGGKSLPEEFGTSEMRIGLVSSLYRINNINYLLNEFEKYYRSNEYQQCESNWVAQNTNNFIKNTIVQVPQPKNQPEFCKEI